jgi:hypothetical protein
MSASVIEFPASSSRAVNEFQAELDALLLQYVGRMSLAEAIGTMQIVMRDLIENQG